MRSIIALGAIMALGTTLALAGDSESYNPKAKQQEIHYKGIGVPSDSKLIHKTLHKAGWERLRTGFRTNYATTPTNHTWMAWLGLNGEGTAKVHYIKFYYVNKKGVKRVVHTQKWDENQRIFGNVFTHTTSWCKERKNARDDKKVWSVKDGCVVMNTTGKPNQMHQLLLSRDNRPPLPADAWKAGIEFKVELTGTAMIRGGLDAISPDFKFQCLLRTPFYQKKHLDKLKGKKKVAVLSFEIPVHVTEKATK